MPFGAFTRTLQATGASLESRLDALLAAPALAQEITRPPRLLAAMRHAALDGGKRLRPFLTVETARMLGYEAPGVWRAACAIELVHCYSLVHDDLPAMDNDDLRRGRPTVHRAFDEATAILAGDALLTLAFDVMADPETHADPAVRCALVTGLARASGLGGMAGGQMLDLQAETASAPLDRAAITALQAMKTGALLRFAVQAGAICAAATPQQAAALGRYGAALGATFQIADDLLDAAGDAVRLGKAAGKDAARNKATLVAALGVAGARQLCAHYLEEALAALSIFAPRAASLEQAVRFAAARDH